LSHFSLAPAPELPDLGGKTRNTTQHFYEPSGNFRKPQNGQFCYCITSLYGLFLFQKLIGTDQYHKTIQCPVYRPVKDSYILESQSKIQYQSTSSILYLNPLGLPYRKIVIFTWKTPKDGNLERIFRH
jgi:hypothetical protein